MAFGAAYRRSAGAVEPIGEIREIAGAPRRVAPRSLSRGRLAPRRDGAATKDLSATVSVPRRPVSAGGRQSLPAASGARRLRGVGQLARGFARVSFAVGAELAARCAEPRQFSGPGGALRRGLAHRPGLQFFHFRSRRDPDRRDRLVEYPPRSFRDREPWLLGWRALCAATLHDSGSAARGGLRFREARVA